MNEHNLSKILKKIDSSLTDHELEIIFKVFD